MELQIEQRDTQRKKNSKRLRRAGRIPAVVYGAGGESTSISIARDEFDTHLRALPKEQLSTTVFVLKGEGGEQKALVKDIQYHPTTYDILHLDFEYIADDQPIRLNVPVRCVGVAECVGIKQGGVLRRVIRKVRVRCLAKDIPSDVTVDVRDLQMRQSRRLSDLAIPPNVQPLMKRNEVIAIIAKK